MNLINKCLGSIVIILSFISWLFTIAIFEASFENAVVEFALKLVTLSINLLAIVGIIAFVKTRLSTKSLFIFNITALLILTVWFYVWYVFGQGLD